MRKVLIVDDSRTFQKVMERLLSAQFEIVGKGASGLEGYELYKKLKPDIVFMDITMPQCSGKEGLKMIMDFDPAAKVVMVSSLADKQTVDECLSLGAKAYIRKDEISGLQLLSAGSSLVDLAKQVLV